MGKGSRGGTFFIQTCSNYGGERSGTAIKIRRAIRLENVPFLAADYLSGGPAPPTPPGVFLAGSDPPTALLSISILQATLDVCLPTQNPPPSSAVLSCTYGKVSQLGLAQQSSSWARCWWFFSHFQILRHTATGPPHQLCRGDHEKENPVQ